MLSNPNILSWTTRQANRHRSTRKAFTFAPLFCHQHDSNHHFCTTNSWVAESVSVNDINSVEFEEQPNRHFDAYTFAPLLRSCGDSKALYDGMAVHHQVIVHGFAEDVFLQGLLVQMYGKCESLDQALHVFYSMQEHTPHSWNFIIRVCAQQGNHSMSLHLFHQMQQEAASPDKFTYVCAFSACAEKGKMQEGMQIHARIVGSNVESDTGIGTAIVNMYGIWGRLIDAKLNFEKMPDWDVVAWNAMLLIYTEHDQSEQALQLFHQMQQEGFLPSKVTLICLCGSSLGLNEGQRLHVFILGSGAESAGMVHNALLNMYGKCGSLYHALLAFEQACTRNVVTWTIMMGLCVQHGQCKGAFQLFSQMHQEGALPERATFLVILSACIDEALLSEGERIVACLIGNEDEVLMTEIVNMYGRCGSVEAARKIFVATSLDNVVTWNTMISVSSQHGLDGEVVQLFEQMLVKGVTPTNVTFIAVLGVCANVREGMRLYAYAIEEGFEADNVLGNAIVSMYGRNGSTEDAWGIFSRMPTRDLVSWNAMIAAYASNQKTKEALELFRNMYQEGLTPDKFTYLGMLEAYAYCNVPASVDMNLNLDVNEHILDALPCRLGRAVVLRNAWNLFYAMNEQDVRAWNAMMDVASQHGDDEREAFLLFDRMQMEGVLPNNESFLSLFALCASQGHVAEGKRMHASVVHSKLESDFAIGTALIKMYSTCGCVHDARQLFDQLSCRNVVVWTAMISAYAQSWQGDEALELFRVMQQWSMLPNNVTYISLLEACSSNETLHEGKSLHARINSLGLLVDVVVLTALIDMYSKIGKLDDARVLFHYAPVLDVFLWNTLISLYSQHGLATVAIELFDAMQAEGVKPDDLSVVSLLTSFSHGGLINDSFCCLKVMFSVYGLLPTRSHYFCMVDILGRAGQMEEAWALVGGMPSLPTEVPYLMLLRACQQHADVEHGECAAMYAFELGRWDTAPYVLLSNIHAARGQLWTLEGCV